MKGKFKLNEKEYKTWCSYKTPGCSNLNRRKVNAIFINPSTSLSHEIEKLRICYEIQSMGGKFLTECVRTSKDEHGKERRVDVVDLSSGFEIEIETTPERAKRFLCDKNVIIIPVGWSKDDEKWQKAVKEYEGKDVIIES